MDYEVTKSEARTGIHIDGDNQIDALLLSDTIKNFAEVTKLTALEIDPDAYIKINVTAFNNGSFEIAFNTISEVRNLITSNPVQAATLAASTVAAVKGIFEIKKMLKGEKPKSMVEDGETIQIENNNGDILSAPKASKVVFGNHLVDNSVTNITYNIMQHNPEGGFSFIGPGEPVNFTAQDLKNMSVGLPCSESTVHRHSVSREVMMIKKADIMGASSWELQRGGKTIRVKINDEDWLEAKKNREFLIGYGDAIEADLEIDIELDKSGQEIEGTARHSINRVIRILPKYEPSEQLQL